VGRGISGSLVHFALLRPITEKDLRNEFFSDVQASSQSKHGFLKEPSISDAPMFVTADYVYGPDESHYSPHRILGRCVALPLGRSFDADRGRTLRKQAAFVVLWLRDCYDGAMNWRGGSADAKPQTRSGAIINLSLAAIVD